MDIIQKAKKQDIHRFKLGVLGLFRWIYLLFRNKKTHYVITTFGAGDAIMSCSYLRAYQRTYGIEHITLVGKNDKEDIFRLYADAYDSLLLYDNPIIIQLSNAFLLKTAYSLFYKWKFRVTPAVLMCHIRNFELSKNGCLFQETTMRGLYRSLVYMLPENTAETFPNMDFSNIDKHKFETIGAHPGQSVFFAPDANSVSKINENFWNHLTGFFNKLGIPCFTNVTRQTDSPLPGTKPVHLSLLEAAAFAEYCGRVIALRSGLCDLLQYADCRLAVVYSGKDGEKTKHFYSLSDSTGKAEVREFIVDPNDSLTLAAEIRDYIGCESSVKMSRKNSARE